MLDYEIIKNYKNININCSGGADSSMMLYELILTLLHYDLNDTNVYVYTLGHAHKENWNPFVAQKVVRFIINHFKTSLIKHHHITYAPVPEPKYFIEAELELRKNYNIDLQMGATSAAPSEETYVVNSLREIVDLSDPCPVPIRQSKERQSKRFFETWYEEYPCSLYTPYINITKDKIAEKYKKYHLLDSLFPLTRSCESYAADTENYTKHCGNCWWCLERKWAFKRLD